MTMAAAILALTTIDNYGDDADNAGNDGAVMARLAALRYCVGIWVIVAQFPIVNPIIW